VVVAAGCYDGAGGEGEASSSSGEESAAATSTEVPDEGSSASGSSTAVDDTTGGPNVPPTIDVPGTVTLAELESFSWSVVVSDPDGDEVRVFALGLPPGARFDEPTLTLAFTPDFIQGGDEAVWDVTFVADDGRARVEAVTSIAVDDTVQPPWPEIVDGDPGDGFTTLYLSQVTDEFLDSPGYAGRSFDAVVTRPDDVPAGERRPVLVVLHGFFGQPSVTGWEGEYRIAPHDPGNTYWWGYGEGLPGPAPTEGAVPPYTQRRVLHLIEWVLRNEPGADPERVYIAGSSMGGAGAATIGLLHARHFASVEAWIWQAIPRNHRPSRIAQLTPWWGAPELGLPDGEADGISAWDRMDLTRALLEDAQARDQWLFLRHGKDDPTIHFGAMVLPSPLTGVAFYEALQERGVGHQAVWDEGAHGPWDPVMGADWWQTGWNPILDDTAWLRRDRAFVGFSNASHDGDPGSGDGNGMQPWDDESGFAGVVAVPGDTGWNGEIAGALNRFLRWDANGIVDEIDRFEVPLHGLDGEGGDPPQAGYPTTGDRFDGVWPIDVDVSLRRVQAFRCRPGEVVDWSFGDVGGEATADEHGEVTIEAVPVGPQWERLVVVRRW
jgi:acetyl esterase/lipase